MTETVSIVGADMAYGRASIYTAYIKGNDIITFGGYKLARVKRLYLGKRRYTPTGGTYRMAYVTAVSHGGVTWHGRYNYESTELITLRRSKRDAQCATIVCKAKPTHALSWQDGDDTVQEQVCKPCADSYLRRPRLKATAERL